MKSIVYIALITLMGTYLDHSTVKESPTPSWKKAKVVLLLDDYTCSEDQWVYLYGYKGWISGNERALFDSTFVHKGQHKIELQSEIPFATEFSILFTRKGPNFGVVVEPDSCVMMNIEETDGEAFYYKRAIQGKLNNDFYDYWQKTIEYRHKLNDLLTENKKDSIEYIKTERYNSLINKLKTTKFGVEVSDIRLMLNVEFPEKSAETNLISKLIAKKFPQIISLQESVKNAPLSPISENSKKIGERLFELKKKKAEIELLDLSIGKKLELCFPDAEGNKVSISDLHTDYILVDFWASWCKPCRQEMPTIKEAIQKHSDKLSVYAVTLDNNREAWQKAIKQDSTQIFKQVIGTYPNGQPSRLLRQLNIKAIPANILIDKEQRIIAKDLQGQEIIQVLDSLGKQ